MEILALLALTVYALIAVFSFYMTFQERRRTGSDSAVYTLAGYLLCLIWPLTVLAILLSPRLRSA
mgnify:CR=1 FL=1